MEFYCREQYGWQGEVIVVLSIGVFHIAVIINDNCAPPSSKLEASANNDAPVAVTVDIAPAPTTAADTANTDANATNTETDEINLRTLDKFRNREFIEKLLKAKKMLSDQQLKLKTMRTSKVKEQQSIETKIFKVLKEIAVELSSYHGGSLNSKNIRKVMTNACDIYSIHLRQF
jgi:hypothetical protein